MSCRRIHTLAPLVAAVAGLAMTPAALGQIEWRSSPDGPAAAAQTPAAVATGLNNLAARPDRSRVVVEFGRALSKAERQNLARLGLTTLAPIGGGAYFAALDPARLDAARVMAAADVRRVRPIDTNWKLHEMLSNGQDTPWAVVGGPAENPTIGVYLQLHQDAPLDADAERLIESFGGTVRDILVTANGYVVEIPRDRIAGLAAVDSVQWIEPALPQMSTLALPNNENRALTHVDPVQSVYGLDGTGVNVLIYDGALASSTHSFYAGRLTQIDGSGVINHATHVAGTIGGAGQAGTGNHRGMATNVTMFSAGFQWGGTGTFLYSNPGDIEQDYGLGINAHGTVLTNNSIGTNTETNGFDCGIQGQYGLTDSIIDEIATGSLGDAPIIVWAAGNERQGGRCNIEGYGQYYSSAPPAGAKNHLCIGAVNANDDSMTSFSAWGPVDDGRMKPDFCAPGCQSNGDGGVTSSGSSGGLATMCGTSMASPTACGIVALMLQDYRDQFPGRPDPMSATVKALLAHTAVDRGNAGPDYQFGYGSIRADAVIDQMRLDAALEVAVEQGEVRSFYFDVAPGETTLKVTAAWADAVGAVNALEVLVNDVDIRLVSPGGTVYHAWTLNPISPASAAVRTGPNRLDNLEQVMVDSPQAGQWICELVGFSVPEGPQTVSVVGPGGMAERGVRLQVASVPDLVDPGTVLDADITVVVVEDTLVPGSVALFARNDGGAFDSIALTDLGGGDYTASLPAALCDDDLEFYVSAEGVDSGVVTSPAGGAASPYSVEAGVFSISFADAFETDLGWTVANSAGMTAGAWQRAVPTAGGGRGDPGNDFDGSGRCYVTDNGSMGDIDAGTTTLTSPIFDGTDDGADISYARWYSNTAGDSPNADIFVVEISNNGGASWTNLETVGPAGTGTSGGWFHVSHRIADTITPTANMRVRFHASDLGAGSVVEAGVDAFEVISFGCENPDTCVADTNGDGTLNFFDVQEFLDLFSAQDPAADFTGEGTFDFADVQAFLNAFSAGCP